MKNFLILVESYWGAGHMNVAAEVAQAITAAGHKVTIATSQSGFDIGATFDFGAATKLAFPGLAKDQNGKAVLTERGLHLNDDLDEQAQRLETLRYANMATPFDGVFIEGWPFGVNAFDRQFFQMANMFAQNHTPVYGIARDVLGYPEPREGDYQKHDMTSVMLANQFLSHIFVTGDPSVGLLEDSLHADAFAKLRVPVDHVGFVGSARIPARQDMPDHDRPVIIAGGGSFKGSVRAHMMQIAHGIAAAKPMSELADNPLLIIVGKEASEQDLKWFESLGNKIKAVKSLDSKDFRQAVSDAALLVHKGGRNIAVDCIQALQQGPVAHIITPMTDETGPWPEAVIRADAMQKAGLSVTLDGDDLQHPEKCLTAIQTSLAQADAMHQRQFKMHLNGAKIIAAILEQNISTMARDADPAPKSPHV